MSVLIKYPLLNPLRFFDSTNGIFSIDDKPSFEYRRGYMQKFTTADFLYLQFHFYALPGSFTMYLMKYNGANLADTVDDTMYPTQITDINFPLLYSYELGYNFADNGIYYLKAEIVIGTQTFTLYSDPVKIAGSHDGTVVLFYDHSENDYDILFTTANCQGMMIRVEGGMKSAGFQPGGKFEMYHDLDYVGEQLDADVFNVEKFTFGPGYGMSKYMIDKLNRAIALNTFKIDGTQYVRNDGAKWERSGSDDYPLAGWSIDLVKKDNPYSDEILGYGNPLRPFTADNAIVTADNAVLTADQTQY